MITIGTNIYNELSEAHRKSISSSMDQIAEQKNRLVLLLQKSVEFNPNDSAKFYLANFPIYKIINDITQWNIFSDILKNLLIYAKQDVKTINDFQFVVNFYYISTSISVFFSAKNEISLKEKVSSMREEILKIVSDISEKNKLVKDKLVILGYDTENKKWKVNYL